MLFFIQNININVQYIKTTYYWNELDEKLINFYQRKESCHETIHVHEQQLQRNNKTALIKHDTCILKSFVSVSTKKVLFLCWRKTNYVMFCYRDFLGGWEKLHRENERSVVFPESRYVNSNPVLGRIFPLVGGIFLLVGWIFFSLVKNFFCPFLQCVFAKGQNFVSAE